MPKGPMDEEADNATLTDKAHHSAGGKPRGAYKKTAAKLDLGS